MKKLFVLCLLVPYGFSQADVFSMDSLAIEPNQSFETPIFFYDAPGTPIDTGAIEGGIPVYFEAFSIQIDFPHGFLAPATTHIEAAGILEAAIELQLSEFLPNNSPGMDRLIWYVIFDGSVLSLDVNNQIAIWRGTLMEGPFNCLNWYPDPINTFAQSASIIQSETMQSGFLAFIPVSICCPSYGPILASWPMTNVVALTDHLNNGFCN